MVTTQIGPFSIQAPRTNPATAVYEDHPEHMEELAGLVTLLKEKYPNLSAMDIGANIGDTACIIKSAADIPLVCIEGDDVTFAQLQQNIRQFESVSAHKLFLGEKTGDVTATFDKVGWNTTIQPVQSAGARTIKIMSLDDFVASEPIPASCKLLKIDAEGFDCSIIRGAAKFLQQTHPVIMFEFNRENMSAIGEKGLDTLAMLQNLGYSKLAFHDCNGRFFTGADFSEETLMRDLLDYSDGKLGSIYYFDITAFHQDDDDVAGRFIAAERSRRPQPLN